MSPAELKIIALGLNVVGIATTGIGAFVAARAIWLTENEAINIGVPRFAGETDEENLRMPAVKALLRQSRGAYLGFWMVVVGSALQAVGAVVGWASDIGRLLLFLCNAPDLA